MAIVYQKNKKSGVTYVYESISFWDKEKKQSRAKRKCIGKLDPTTQQVVPTHKKQSSRPEKPATQVKRGPVPTIEAAHSFYGATHLFDLIGQKTGVTKDLKACFPNTYKQILSVAYYLILEDKNPLSRFPKWAFTHKHPYDKVITSQRSSELFTSVTDDARERFFKLQGARRAKDEFWAYDTTSISSYSNSLTQVRYGVNKDHDPLPQINLALLFGEQSNLPFYYRKLPGNIHDVKTVMNLLADMRTFGVSKANLVMDRGFYSEKNINALYKNHLKFLIATKKNLRFVNNEIEKLKDNIRSWSNYSSDYDLYAKSSTIKWKYSQRRPNKGDVLSGERRMYVHIYYNAAQAVDDERKFHKMLRTLHEELESGKRNPNNEKKYEKYFTIKTTPVRGTQVIAKDEAIEKAKQNYGYFVLLSNIVKDPIKAIEIYRNKDLVEKAFCDLKDRLGFNRPAVSSDMSLDGKLFVEFIALIYLSYIKKQMKNGGLFQKYTMQSLLDEFDIIECYEQPGRTLRVGEMTKNQTDLYKHMGVEPPSSL